MDNHATEESNPLQGAIVSLIRSIPERWADFDHEALSSSEQQALFLLVAAGLVERRICVRGEFAGQASGVEFTIDVSGEYGLVEAMDAAVSELWTRWASAFEVWKASDAKSSTPFRVTSSGLNRWRLTDQGVIARGDLDVQSSSTDSAATVGSTQRVIDFVTRTGSQAGRPVIRGAGRLVELKTDPGETKPIPTQVTVVNREELAEAFRDTVVPGIVAAVDAHTTKHGKTSYSPGNRGRQVSGMPIEEVIAKAEAHVKAHRGVFPGRNKLANIVGCSPSSITKAVTRSVYLKARKAEYEATKRGSSPERQSSQPLEDLASNKDWKKSEADRDEALEALIEDQDADRKREESQRTRARRRKHSDD